jgi:hypothetical protein
MRVARDALICNSKVPRRACPSDAMHIESGEVKAVEFQKGPIHAARQLRWRLFCPGHTSADMIQKKRRFGSSICCHGRSLGGVAAIAMLNVVLQHAFLEFDPILRYYRSGGESTVRH